MTKLPVLLGAIGILATSATAFAESSALPSSSVIAPSSGSNPSGTRKNSPPVGPLPAVEEDDQIASSTCSSEGICVDNGSNLNDGRKNGKYYCVEDNPVNVRDYELANTLSCFHDTPV